MGLEMLLDKQHCVANWERRTPDKKHAVLITRGGKARDDIKSERIMFITEGVAYWKNSFAIHGWFIENVQEGVDDGKRHYVESEQLEELLKIVREVLAHSKLVPATVKTSDGMKPDVETGQVIEDDSKARELLPDYCDGCYEQSYVEDLVRTEMTLAQILSEPDEGAYYFYQSDA